MPRFTLLAKRWYACEFMGDFFVGFGPDQSDHSPILVHKLQVAHAGTRTFRLVFHHANYPAGVQTKTYTLRTLVRGQHYLLARQVEDEEPRILRIHEITPEWMTTHFPHVGSVGEDVQEWLTRQHKAGRF